MPSYSQDFVDGQHLLPLSSATAAPRRAKQSRRQRVLRNIKRLLRSRKERKARKLEKLQNENVRREAEMDEFLEGGR